MGFSSLALLALAFAGAPQGEPALRVYIRAGEKTHGPGEHDHPRFLEEWTPLLRERGCAVDGSLAFPSAEALARTDVLVMYAAEGGSIHGDERARLDAYLARGGGIVVLHDAVCGDDPHWFKTVVGGAWEHGHSKWQHGEMGLYFADREHPITRGVSNFDFVDEIYWDLHLDPGAHVLANAFHTPFDVTPQMWVYEKDAYRAFVSIQGHYHASFSHEAWRTLLLRGIAWAGGRDADALVTAEEVAELRYPPGGPLAPERAHEPFELHPEFEISLVAAEPLVVNPISVDWDADGRMWVACTPGYPYKAEFSGVPPHDSIVVLSDGDGDGRMDESRVFYEGLDLVTSLVHHGDGVIVAMAPHVLWLRDLDGDDVCDRAEVLYTGFGYGDTHATISNLRFGMDGWLYATQGYSGGASNHVHGSVTEPRPTWSPTADGDTDPRGGWGLGMDRAAEKPFGRIPNGLLRFRPDGSAIETVVSYGSNTWGLDFAWDGELFFTMANGSHLRHVVLPDRVLAGARFGDSPSWVDVVDHRKAFQISSSDRPPYHQIDFVGGFTGAAGSLIYTGGAWPDDFGGDHFVCEPTINLVHRDKLAPAGPTVRASKPREQEFLASTDLWFRPVHLRVGPDGAMYVLDFYNQAAVHNDTRGPRHGPTNAAVRPDRDRMHGRVWRVQHREATNVSGPPLASASSRELLASLEEPNRWRRATAQRLLRERGPDDRAFADAVALFSHQSALPEARLHALWLLDNWGEPDEVIVAALDDPDPSVRKNAARILAARGGTELPTELTLLAVDQDPATRLAGLLALSGRAIPAELAPAFVELYLELEEDWSRSAVLGAFADEPEVLLRAALEDPRSAELADLAAECALRAARAHDEHLHAAIEAVAAHGDGSPALLEGALLGLVRGLGEGGTPPESAESLARLLEHEAIEVAIAALPLAARLVEAPDGVDALASRLYTLSQDPDAALELRLRCLDALLALPDRRAEGVRAAERFLDPYFPLETQLRVIEAVSRAAEDPAVDAAATDTLLEAFPRVSNDAREQIFHTVMQRPARIDKLLGRFDANRIGRNDLGPHRIHRLKNHPDADVARRANDFFAAFERAPGAIDALIAELLPAVEAPGDAANGRMLFRQNCGNCHALNGEGGAIGPDLTGMGAHGVRALLPFILDPNRSVEAAYLEYAAQTVDGRNFAGIVVREAPDHIVLRSTAGDEEIPRDEIESLTSTGRTPMPEGFETLGAEGLRDILAYMTAGYGDYRVLDLELLGTSTTNALYDLERDRKPMRFRATGIVDAGSVPFEILDPERVPLNAITLRGGMVADWDSKSFPQRVEVPVGFALERLHVLGGIAAWGFPFTASRSPIVKLTWRYADGETEELVLTDGDRFADWIRRHDVPGSVYVDLLEPGSVGQVRHFSVDPSRTDVAVEAIVLSSFDNHLAPTFLALTAQVRGAASAPPVPPPWEPPAQARVLVFGGGSSHDFRRWFHEEDFRTLAAEGERLHYEELPRRLAELLPQLDVLVLCNNQPLPDAALREAIFAHADGGRGLLLVHAATWFNWRNWPEYNRKLVGGGSRSHEALGEFEVVVDAPEHPLMEGVPATFRITDELYRFERAAQGSPIEVLATGRSLTSGASYPVVWTVQRDGGPVVCITLGHDGAAHTHEAYRTLLRNAVAWLSDR